MTWHGGRRLFSDTKKERRPYLEYERVHKTGVISMAVAEPHLVPKALARTVVDATFNRCEVAVVIELFVISPKFWQCSGQQNSRVMV